MKYSILFFSFFVSYLCFALEAFKTNHFIMECDPTAYTANVFNLSDLQFVTKISLSSRFQDTIWIKGADRGSLTHEDRLEIYLFSLAWVRYLHSTDTKWQDRHKITFSPITMSLDFFSYLSKSKYRFIVGGIFFMKDIEDLCLPVLKYQPNLSQ